MESKVSYSVKMSQIWAFNIRFGWSIQFQMMGIEPFFSLTRLEPEEWHLAKPRLALG